MKWRCIIAGSRTIADRDLVFNAIVESGFDICEVVCGMARGVDTAGELWAIANKIPVKRFPAEWSKHGRAAGAIRNTRMAEYANALILIHNCSPGSLDMLSKARGYGLVVFEKRI